MKNSSLFIIVFSLIFLIGCSAIKDLISGGEVPDVSSYDTDTAKDQVLSSVTASVSSGHASSENGAAIQGNNLESESLSRIDSLKEKLLTDGSVKINPAEAYLIDYLRPKQNPDTLFLANLYFETGKKGIPITFQYQVKKDDQIFFEFENQKSRKIKKIEIIEGGESRFNHTNLKKKKIIKGSLTIQSDNMMTINVLKNGFFKSVVKMKIRKLSKPQSYSLEMVKDTLIETRTVIEEIVDTLFAKVEDKKYSLSPRLDITHTSRIDFPIEVKKVENLIGWGYWLGLNREDLEKYKTLAEADEESEPLVSFIKSELNINQENIYLPQSENPDVYFNLRKLVADTPSLNTKTNYGYFISEPSSQAQKAKIYLANKSKLYEHNISLLVVAVNLEHSQKEIEKEFYTEIPSLKLTLIP